MKHVFLFNSILTVLTLMQANAQTVTDYDGNVYDTVHIGDQAWFKQNLKVIHFSNGDSISDGTGIGDINGQSQPKYFFDYNDSSGYAFEYGKLYTWYAVIDSRNICPTGWRVPNDNDWHDLALLLDTAAQLVFGNVSITAGGMLKDTGTTHWISPNSGATNETGFMGLPGGTRWGSGSFFDLGEMGWWWTRTSQGANFSFFRTMHTTNAGLGRGGANTRNGCSVRCIKESGTGTNHSVKPDNTVNIYPNPASNKLKVELLSVKEFSVEIISISGQLLQRVSLISSEALVDITDLNAGFYFVKIQTETETLVRKLIKK